MIFLSKIPLSPRRKPKPPAIPRQNLASLLTTQVSPHLPHATTTTARHALHIKDSLYLPLTSFFPHPTMRAHVCLHRANARNGFFVKIPSIVFLSTPLASSFGKNTSLRYV